MTEIAMHGHGVRGMKRETLHSFDGIGDPGKFGVMFPDLLPLYVDDDALFELANAMQDTPLNGGVPDPAGDNDSIPAGYTYLGQFIDHDITLDTTPLDQQRADPNATTNFRTPALDLDSLYGDGPDIHPYLYQRDPRRPNIISKMLTGHAVESLDLTAPKKPDGTPVFIRELDNDLPRNQVGHALIFDERNDENLLVAQLHLLMLKFHNKVFEDWIPKHKPGLSDRQAFAEARRIVTWHYQWIVLFDFVERLTEPGLINRIKHQGRQFYRFKERPYMPAEFAAAVYRLGHSMVRETYSHNRIFNPAGLDLLFAFTGKSGIIVGELAPDPAKPPLEPQKGLPSNWVIDWRRFFDLDTPAAAGIPLNHSRKLDPMIAPALHTLPGFPDTREKVLPFRNLRRGVQIGLPSGQDVCRAMKLDPMTAADIQNCPGGAIAAKHGMDAATPLWYYVLCEAHHHGGGKRLGPMASTILAETFLGMVHGDKQSFLWQRSNWTPELPCKQAGHFTMADLIRFVGEDNINPIGAQPGDAQPKPPQTAPAPAVAVPAGG